MLSFDLSRKISKIKKLFRAANLTILLLIVIVLGTSCASTNKLLEAVDTGNPDNVRELIKLGKFKINATNKSGQTALFLAARAGNLEMVKILVESGAGLDILAYDFDPASDEPGVRPPDETYSPLWIAYYNSHYKVGRYLADQGADVNTKGMMDWTPVIITTLMAGDEETRFLLEKEADPNIVSYDFMRHLPLYTALHFYNSETKKFRFNESILNTVKLLLEFGADPNMPGPQLDTMPVWTIALSRSLGATDTERLGLIELFIENGLKIGADGVIAAARLGSYSIMQFTLDESIKMGTNVNATNKNGGTALMVAADSGYVEIADLLIKNGADVNASNNEGWTALMKAAYGNYHDVSFLLLENGADVNATKEDGWTALMMAARYNDSGEIVSLLLGNGADVNATKENGWTALMLAARYNDNSEIVSILLESGADVNASDEDGWTALMLAARYNDNGEIVSLLLGNGADVNASNKDGWTALMMAARYNDSGEIVSLLLGNGADVNATKEDGWTALMLAAYQGNYKTVQGLLDNGANPNMKSTKGSTALKLAQNQDKTEIVNLLKHLTK